MKFSLTIITCLLIVLGLQNCMSSRKVSMQKTAATYTADVMPVIEARCTPCHFPPGGNKLPLNTYAAVKANIGEILERVKLDPSNSHFMPYKNKKPALGDSLINVLEQWKNSGMKG